MNPKETYVQPAEWSLHRAVWLAWPSDPNLWEQSLASAQNEFVDFCRAIADVDPQTGKPRGEQLEILIGDDKAHAEAKVRLAGLPVRFRSILFGDIWLRDTAPIFVKNSEGSLVALKFGFNGWGQKYVLFYDDQVAEQIIASMGVVRVPCPMIFEGGSIDVDGEGTALTTMECLLNKNRNPQLNQADIEQTLKQTLGLKKILWLRKGLVNDHTDGHIDTLARFVAPGVVVCMRSEDPNDPNAEVLLEIENTLKTLVDARGRALQVMTIPSPGRVVGEDGKILPASYVNFYIANTTVIVPTYDSPWDVSAVQQIATLFPHRKTLGLSAKAILSGGGAFHCISQQEPL